MVVARHKSRRFGGYMSPVAPTSSSSSFIHTLSNSASFLIWCIHSNFEINSRFQQKMLCRGRNSIRCRKAGSVPVYLNVYDLTSMNGCAYWLGLGAYHSGVQGLISNLDVVSSWFDEVGAPYTCSLIPND